MRVVRVSIVISMLLVMLAVQTVTATHWTSRTVVDKSVAQQCVGGTKIEAPQSGVGYIVFYDGFQGSITFTLNGTLSFATDQPAPCDHVHPDRGWTDERRPLHVFARCQLRQWPDGTLQPQQRQAVRLQPRLHLHCEEVISRNRPRCPR